MAEQLRIPPREDGLLVFDAEGMTIAVAVNGFRKRNLASLDLFVAQGVRVRNSEEPDLLIPTELLPDGTAVYHTKRAWGQVIDIGGVQVAVTDIEPFGVGFKMTANGQPLETSMSIETEQDAQDMVAYSARALRRVAAR